MKKITIAVLVAAVTLMSCNTERTAADSLYNPKAAEILNFEKAIMSLSRPENRSTEEERRSQKSLELSDRRKDLLIPSAVQLITSTGVSEKHVMKTTNGDRDAILTWAVKIYNAKKNTTSNNN